MFKPAAPYTALKLLQAGLDMKLGAVAAYAFDSLDDIVDIHPSTRRPIPFKFPLQPPTKLTFLSLLFSTSKWISLEQVPCVLYTI
mgnify:CR=1 FL=1